MALLLLSLFQVSSSENDYQDRKDNELDAFRNEGAYMVAFLESLKFQVLVTSPISLDPYAIIYFWTLSVFVGYDII